MDRAKIEACAGALTPQNRKSECGQAEKSQEASKEGMTCGICC